MRYHFNERSERFDELLSMNVDRYFDILEQECAESVRVAKSLMYAAFMHGCVMISKHGSQWHYLHRSPKYAGDLQLTTWDRLGPVSDMRVSKAEDFSHIMNGDVEAYVA